MMRSRISRLLCGAVLAAPFAVAPAAADPVADFYRGKQITIVVGTALGGSYGFYSRLMIEYWPKYIPGNPTFILQGMSGAGGRAAANYMANVAPRDGTKLGMPLYLTPMNQALKQPNIQYDVTRFQWIGSMANIVSVLAVRDDSGVKTIEEAQRKEVIMGATGRASETFTLPTVANRILGTKFKIISGYKGTDEIDIAIERGEVQGRGGSWASLKQGGRSKNLILLAQVGVIPDTELKGLPRLLDYARSADDKAALELLSGGAALARAFYAPPEVPKERVDALRRAFDATMKDPAFRAEAQKRDVAISPVSGAEVEAVVARIIATPSSVIERVAAILK